MWLKKQGYLINMDNILAIETYQNPFKLTLVNAKPIGPRLHRVDFNYVNGEAVMKDYEKIVFALEDELGFLDLDKLG